MSCATGTPITIRGLQRRCFYAVLFPVRNMFENFRAEYTITFFVREIERPHLRQQQWQRPDNQTEASPGRAQVVKRNAA